jgi:hypothetical protein
MTAQQVSSISESKVQCWRRLIEAACTTVASEPAWLVETVLVVQRFDELTDRERDELMRLSYRAAQNHGVVAMPAPDSDSLAIWFGRRERKEEAQGVIRLAYVRPAERGDVIENEGANG